MDAAALVSICIPSYNYGRYLRGALDAALAQSYAHTEVVVVDDGSTDGSMDVLDAYRGHPKVRVFRNPRNLGIAGNHNAAANFARGEYLAFPSADDLLLPDFVERTLAVFHRFDGRGYDLGLVMGDRDQIDAEGRRSHFVPFYPGSFVCRGDRHARVAMMGNPGGPTQWLVKARALRAVGGFRALYGTAHDWELMFRMCCRFDFAYLDEKLCLYRWHRNQSTTTIATLQYICNIHLMKLDMAARVRSHPYLGGFVDESIRRTGANAVNFALECVRSGNVTAARQHLLMAEAFAPGIGATQSHQALSRRVEAVERGEERAVSDWEPPARMTPYDYPEGVERF